MLKEIFDEDLLIGIFGFGVTGRAVAKWCDKHNIRKRLFDDNVKECDPFSEEKIAECDVIVRSPSFLDENRWVRFVREHNIPCITELDLAAEFWKGRIIAVTGTDGKTTTTEFLAHALQCVGYQAVAVGNNGRSLLEYTDDAINVPSNFAVIEISSFQASALSKLYPDYVIWTNFAPDHINVHGSLENYFAAKYNLIRLCHNPDTEHIFIGTSVAEYAKKNLSFGLLQNSNVHTDIAHLPVDSALNISVQRENYALVEALWQVLQLPFQLLEKAALSFKLPEHRLQRVAAVKKAGIGDCVEFWDDSKATNFHSFQAALHSFDKKIILIAGGRSKGEDIDQYVDEICRNASSVLLMGETGEQIYSEILLRKSEKFFNLLRYYGGSRENAEKIILKIVNDAFCVALPGDVVLLGPGFASFDMFTSFNERGDLYKKCILKLNF